MKNLKLGVCALGLFSIVGCASPYSPGYIFSDYNSLLSTPDDAQGLTPGPKVGEAMMVNYLGIVATGDASVTAAANNGNIKKIQTVDYKYNSILGIINKTTTIVTGQ